jgi:glycine cleavage system aminomethyltransferase T
LAYIQKRVEENIEVLDVLVFGKRCRATIVPHAFYDPVNERCRA